MRRLEDVPDLRCLEEIKRGKHAEDYVCKCVRGACTHIEISTCVYGLPRICLFVTFSDRIVIENETSDSVPVYTSMRHIMRSAPVHRCNPPLAYRTLSGQRVKHDLMGLS